MIFVIPGVLPIAHLVFLHNLRLHQQYDKPVLWVVKWNALQHFLDVDVDVSLILLLVNAYAHSFLTLWYHASIACLFAFHHDVM